MRLHTDKETLNILSVKHRMSSEVVEDIINHGLQSIKECMIKDEMPNILIHNLGRFKPSKTKIDKKFESALRQIESNKLENVNWDEVERYLKAYDRILIEEGYKESEYSQRIRKLLENRNEQQVTNSLCPEHNDTSNSQVS